MTVASNINQATEQVVSSQTVQPRSSSLARNCIRMMRTSTCRT